MLNIWGLLTSETLPNREKTQPNRKQTPQWRRRMVTSKLLWWRERKARSWSRPSSSGTHVAGWAPASQSRCYTTTNSWRAATMHSLWKWTLHSVRICVPFFFKREWVSSLWTAIWWCCKWSKKCKSCTASKRHWQTWGKNRPRSAWPLPTASGTNGKSKRR